VPPLEHDAWKGIAGAGHGAALKRCFTLDKPVAGLRAATLLAISVPKPASENSVALPYSATLLATITLYPLVDGRLSRVRYSARR